MEGAISANLEATEARDQGDVQPRRGTKRGQG